MSLESEIAALAVVIEDMTDAVNTIPSILASSQSATAASYDAFDDRYLGSKASDPTLDNDGNALLTGALYWNSGSNQLRVYNGSSWQSTFIDANDVSFTQAGTGAVARSVRAKERDRVSVKDFGATGDGVTNDTAAIQAAFTYAYNSGGNDQKTVHFPAGIYVIATTITAQCSMEGEGPPHNNAGVTLKWTGSSAKMFDVPTYVTGWYFKNLTFDTSSVSTAVSMLYFDLGLNGFLFENCKFKGYHTGASWGGTYADHDAIYVVGGSGGTKYDFSNGSFINCQFQRCRDGVVQPSDPSNGGPGNSITFINCLSWCSRNSVKLFGANNTLINCEFNTESAQHTVVQAGGFAVGWVYIACDWGTAVSSAGNEPIYADTSGSANFASILGGTVQTSDGGGIPSLILDAGATGGAVFRYMAQGVNNYGSRFLYVDQLILGQADEINNAEFYKEGTWTPSFTGLTEVLGGGSVTYTGKYTLVGNVVYWTVRVDAAGGATTESTAGTTFITNMPFISTGITCTCTASNAGNLASYGVGQGDVTTNNMFTPTWPAVSNDIIISGFYFTDRTT